MNIKILLVLISSLLLVACESANEITVNKAEYGDKWPLNVEQAVLRCDQPNIAFLQIGDMAYALNGSALSAGLPRPDAVLKNTDIIELADFTQIALQICLNEH